MPPKRVHRQVGTYPVVRPKHSGKSESTSKPFVERFQTLIGVVISIATAFIAWQTYTLSERTEANNLQLKSIEQVLSQDRLGFERVRDIYDRTEKYLSSPAQTESRGRILVVLINDIPDSTVRTELLSVVTKEAKLPSVAAKAADLKVGKASSEPIPTTITNSSELSSSKPSESSNQGSIENINPKVTETRKGSFSGRLRLQAQEDGTHYVTAEEFAYIDAHGVEWKVPKGFASDGTSIPRALWALYGGPFSGNIATASVIHEYYASTRSRPWQQVNRMLYECMQDSGVSESTAKAIYMGVMVGGPRWSSASEGNVNNRLP